MKLVLNVGCGKTILKDTNNIKYLNIDALIQKADNYLQWDLIEVPYPLSSNMADEIYFFHCIEHIPENLHPRVLNELRRIIKPTGKIAISYPEFKKCALNYITNKQGQREFWKATIYGRGLTDYDRHISLMDTEYFIKLLNNFGLEVIRYGPEKKEDYNTVVICKKVEPRLSYEQLMGEEFRMNVPHT